MSDDFTYIKNEANIGHHLPSSKDVIAAHIQIGQHIPKVNCSILYAWNIWRRRSYLDGYYFGWTIICGFSHRLYFHYQSLFPLNCDLTIVIYAIEVWRDLGRLIKEIRSSCSDSITTLDWSITDTVDWILSLHASHCCVDYDWKKSSVQENQI